MKRIGGAVALSAIVLAAGCQSSSSGSSDVDTGSQPSSAATSAKAKGSVEHSEDITITACAADATTGYLSADVTVKNNSSKKSNYIITIAFESKDGGSQLDTGLVAVNNLEAGQSSDQQAGGLKEAPAGGYTYKLADLTRYAS